MQQFVVKLVKGKEKSPGFKGMRYFSKRAAQHNEKSFYIGYR